MATKTPSRSLRYRAAEQPRSKFDFDAPQYEDFTHPRYAQLRRRLEEAVFSAEKRASWTVEPVPVEDPEDGGAEIIGDFAVGAAMQEAEEDDRWFECHHLEHEPSSPLTPAGPLITPESAGMIRGRGGGGSPSVASSPPSRATPLGRHMTQAPSPLSVHSLAAPGTLGDVPHRLPGLRGARPMRVLAVAGNPSGGGREGGEKVRGAPGDCTNDEDDGQSRDSSRSGWASSLGGSPMVYPEMDEIKTPTANRSASRRATPLTGRRRWRVSMWGGHVGDEPRRSSSIEARRPPGGLRSDQDAILNVATTIDTSFPESSPLGAAAWSSIPETPPILASGFRLSGGGRGSDGRAIGNDLGREERSNQHEDEDDGEMVGVYRKRSLPKDSPAIRSTNGGGGGGGLLPPPAQQQQQPSMRRIGLARAMRVERPEIEEYRPPTTLLVRQLALQAQQPPKTAAEPSPPRPPRPSAKAKSPIIKRQKVDARFCPAPAPVSKVSGLIIVGHAADLRPLAVILIPISMNSRPGMSLPSLRL